MRKTFSTDALNSSSLLKFNPQLFGRLATRENRMPPIETPMRGITLFEEISVPDNRLLRPDAIYFSEPDDVRRCIERLLPSKVFNLVLSDKVI